MRHLFAICLPSDCDLIASPPQVLSIACAVAGGCIQSKAEDALIAARPDLYPPRLSTVRALMITDDL